MTKECKECKKVASYFHSKCCNRHFEGVIKDGKLFIACEDCGELHGELKE